MKRDIQLNMDSLRWVSARIKQYMEALQQMEEASARFLNAIKDQDSKSYEELAVQWEEKVSENETELKERLAIIVRMLDNYIVDMESYLQPVNPSVTMRVDRNDVWFNYTQMKNEVQSFSFGGASDLYDIIMDTGSSWKNYGQCFIWNIFEDEETNNRRRADMEAAERNERSRRESNYAKLESFRNLVMERMYGSMNTALQGIKGIHDNNIIEFENTDDAYSKRLGEYYQEWSTMGDRYVDQLELSMDVAAGALDAGIDFVAGTGILAWRMTELNAWTMLQPLKPLGLMPEGLEEDVGQMQETAMSLLEDPGNIVEALGQGVCDTVDEKGLAYATGYVAVDMFAIDKVLGKIDDVADMARGAEVVRDAENVAETTRNTARVAETTADSLKGATVSDDVAHIVEEADKMSEAGKVTNEMGQAADVSGTGAGVNAGADASKAGKSLENIDTSVDGTAGKVETVDSDGVSSIKGVSEGGGDTVTYRRVQGGSGNNASQVRIEVNADGTISIPNKDANLSISIDGGEHAEYF